jgi:hypothetical protein
MHALRSPRSVYVAAFFLGAFVALAFSSLSRAEEPFRLDRIGVVRFAALGGDQLLRQSGVLRINGETTWRAPAAVARPDNTPAWALNRTLISREAWLAYYALGSGALSGFQLLEGAVTIWVGTEEFKAVAPDPDTAMFDGRVVNLSTRGVLQGGADEIIAGFVVEGRPRTVLIRAIGPSLAQYHVPNPAPDPAVTLRQAGESIAANDDWSDQPEAALVGRAITRAGAFPLEPGSRDAAVVAVLAPGAYTAHARTSSANRTAGEVMVEIYLLPEDVLYEPDPA